MTKVILDKRNLSLDYATDCMIVRADNQPPRTLPLSRIEQLICMHSVQLTTQLIGQLHKRGIDLIVMNQRYADHSFAIFADQKNQVERRCRQYAWQLHEQGRLPFAKHLCDHKFTILKRALNTVEGTAQTQQKIAQIQMQLIQCEQEQTLRGIEGSIQRIAFEQWRHLLPSQLGFTKRERRPPKDPVNAILSLTYTLIHHEAVRQAHKYALDPQLGFYHRVAFGRQSLACDLMEPVRPRAELWITQLFVSGVLNLRHFSQTDGRCLLGKAGRELFYAAYDEQLNDWKRVLEAGARWTAHRLDSALPLA